jgi:hypothetical protein
MRLESKVRLERLATLGAALESGATAAPQEVVARLRGALPDGKELGTAIGWSDRAAGSRYLAYGVTVIEQVAVAAFRIAVI